MSLIPCTNWNEKGAQLQLAATELGTAMQSAQGVPVDFAQKVLDSANTALQVLAQTSVSNPVSGAIDICGQLDAQISILNDLGDQLAQITGKPSVTAKYLSRYQTGSALGTILTLGVVGLVGWWLYKYMAEGEFYPRQLLPRYAGGSRRLR